MFFYSANMWHEVDLVLPDGGRIHYTCVAGANCNHWTTAVLEHTSTNSQFHKSVITYNGFGWNIRLKDGTVYVMGDNTPLQAIRDRHGNQVSIVREGGQGGNISRVISPSGRWIEFTYNGSNRMTQAKDNAGRTVIYEYDASGRVSKVTDPNKGITEYTYDSSHRMLTIKDPRGIVFLTNQYDPASGRVTKQTLADNAEYQFVYTLDGGGKVVQTDVTDPRGFVRQVTFNADGQILTDTRALNQPEQQITEYEYQTGTNFLLTVTDPLEVSPGVRRKTTYTYDANGNMQTVTRNAQDSNQSNWVTTTYTYDPTLNQVTTITDPLNHTTSFFYDSGGNLERVRDANNNETTYTYNPAGQALTVTTPAGTTQFVYEFGDLVSVIDPLENATQRFVDGIGRLQSVTNPLGLITIYSYDDLNRMTNVIDPLNGPTRPTQFEYDPNSNLSKVKDAKTPQAVTTYTYDNMDRLQTRTDPLQKSESYVYDAAGNLTLFRDRKFQATTYAYDALNRRTNATYADGSSTSYTYDKGNRLTQINDSIAGAITRTYDTLDRLTSEQTPQGTVGYTYDKASRRETMTVPGQALISYTYDNANRLTQITQGSSIVQFGYDTSNRRTSLTLPNGILVEYGYDLASRVTSITYKQNGTTVIGDLTYEYDKAGNRTKVGGSWARTGMPEPLTTTSYDANNRQLIFSDKALVYDDNGNLQSITDSNGTTLYSWNARNQLVGISGSNVNASFLYDGLGRREAKTINGSLTEFLYDGVNPVQESAGVTILANTLLGLGIDEFLTRTDIVAGITNSFLVDAIGSPVALTDVTGAPQTEYVYEAFGRTNSTGTPNSNAFQFTGRDNDATHLYYYRARYYHPELQRFLSEDPIGSPVFGSCSGNGSILLNMMRSGAGQLSQTPNLYGYVSNQPTVFTDPSGLSPCFDQFQECLQQVNKNQIRCQNNVAKVASLCLANCAAGCLIAGPGPQYPACVASCIAYVCVPVTIAGNAACLAQSMVGRWNCWQEYVACERNSSSPGRKG